MKTNCNSSQNGICYIVGAGDDNGLDFTPSPEDFVIAADAGILCLEKYGITADLAIGDFDSLGAPPIHPNIKRLNPFKDETDLYSAICEGINAGYSQYHIYGGTGGRTDHTIANVQLLAYLSQNKMRGYLFGKDSIITAITNDRIAFKPIRSGYVSVFSYTEKCCGVYLSGLKYELENAVMANTFPLGVSNEFIGSESSISVADGTLLIVFPKSAMEWIAG